VLIKLRREKEKIIHRLAQDKQARRRVRLGYFLNTTTGQRGRQGVPVGTDKDRGHRDKQGRQIREQRQAVRRENKERLDKRRQK
jgi:hypothetical protein